MSLEQALAGSIASGNVSVTASYPQPTKAEANPPRTEQEEPCMEHEEPRMEQEEPSASDETNLAKIVALLDAEHLVHSKCIAKITAAKISIKEVLELRRKMSSRR